MERARSIRQAAFTLIELTITLVIIAVLAVYVAASWPGSSLSLDAEAEKIAQDIRLIHAISMSRGQRYRVTFFSNQYQLSDSNGTPLNHPALASSTVLLGDGITLNSSVNQLEYDRLGIPYQDIATPLSSIATITLTSSDGQTRFIQVNPQTGKVTLP